MIPQAIHREGEADEGFELGERLLYLRTPYFTGKDVEQLQTALGALGFACGGVSGTFGAYTEGALRKLCDAAPFAQCVARQASNRRSRIHGIRTCRRCA